MMFGFNILDCKDVLKLADQQYKPTFFDFHQNNKKIAIEPKI